MLINRPIIFKILTLFLNFLFYKILTDNLAPDLFGKIIYFFSISMSISILSNLGSDTIISKIYLKKFGEDILKGKIKYHQFHFITLIISILVSPIIAIIYGFNNFEDILIITIVSFSLTNAKVFGANFLSIKNYFYYYYYSVFGFLFCIILSIFLFKNLTHILIFSSFLMNFFILLMNFKFKFLNLKNFFKIQNLNIDKFKFTITNTLPFIIILYLAASHELIGHYWLNRNFNYELVGQSVLLHRIASLTVLGLAAMNLVAYSSFNKIDIHYFDKNSLKEYLNILFISLFFSIIVTFFLFLTYKFILIWFNLPLDKNIILSLSVLITGQFIVICFGPVAMAMTQFGNQKSFSIIYVLGCIFNFIILFSYEKINFYYSTDPLIFSSIAYSLTFIFINLIALIYLLISKTKKEDFKIG